MKSILLALALLAAPFASAIEMPALASASELRQYDWLGDIQPPTQVNERIWRSGRPTEAHLRDLYAQGVRVIIDLEDNADAIQAEKALATSIGFDFHTYPTDSFFAPDDAKMNEIIEILRSSPEKILVHCYHGEDRTGLVIGLERVFLEKWTPAKAYDEMIAKGFHRVLFGLDQYFRTKTASN